MVLIGMSRRYTCLISTLGSKFSHTMLLDNTDVEAEDCMAGSLQFGSSEGA